MRAEDVYLALATPHSCSSAAHGAAMLPFAPESTKRWFGEWPAQSTCGCKLLMLPKTCIAYLWSLWVYLSIVFWNGQRGLAGVEGWLQVPEPTVSTVPFYLQQVYRQRVTHAYMVIMTLRGTCISSLLVFLLGQQGHRSGGKSGAASQPIRKQQLSLQAALALLFGLLWYFILYMVDTGHKYI